MPKETAAHCGRPFLFVGLCLTHARESTTISPVQPIRDWNVTLFSNRPRFYQCLLGSLVLAICSFRAHAFCFAPPLEVSDEYFVSPLVVEAEVLSSRDVTDPTDRDSITGTFYRIRISRVYRGRPGDLKNVYSENSTGRFPMLLKHRYVLFLNRDPDHHWTVDHCGNSRLLPQGNDTVRQLRTLPLRQSFVYGDVYSYRAEMTCPPIELTLSGPTQVTTTVHHDCSFRVPVAPGNYAARMQGNGRKLPAYDLPYKDVYCFTVPRGGSAGIAFRMTNGADKLNLDSIWRDDALARSRCNAGQQNKPSLR